MAVSRAMFKNTFGVGVLVLFLSLLVLIQPVSAAPPGYIVSPDASGKTVYLEENRQPALYTGDFGDCLGGSLMDLTRFDAAYYQDNMTVTFHMSGSTQLNNESLVCKSRPLPSRRHHALTHHR